MKGGVGTALALGVGYILGRRRNMRLATMLAVGAASGGAAKLGPIALRQGTKYLGKTDIAGALGPQLTEIVETVRGELLDAAKGAAAAAVTSRIDSLIAGASPHAADAATNKPMPTPNARRAPAGPGNCSWPPTRWASARSPWPAIPTAHSAAIQQPI